MSILFFPSYILYTSYISCYAATRRVKLDVQSVVLQYILLFVRWCFILFMLFLTYFPVLLLFKKVLQKKHRVVFDMHCLSSFLILYNRFLLIFSEIHSKLPPRDVY